MKKTILMLGAVLTMIAVGCTKKETKEYFSKKDTVVVDTVKTDTVKVDTLKK